MITVLKLMDLVWIYKHILMGIMVGNVSWISFSTWHMLILITMLSSREHEYVTKIVENDISSES